MPRVLHLIGNFDEYRGGAQRVILDIVTACHNFEMEMGVCSLYGKATLARRLPAGVFNVHLNYRLKWNPAIYINLYRIITSWNPDILHVHSTIAGLFGRPIASLLGIKQISTVHNDVRKTPLRNWIIDKLTIGMSDCIICVSETVMESVIKTYQRSIVNTSVVRINNQLDCDKFKEKVSTTPDHLKKTLKLDKKRYIAGTVGRLHPVKGHRYLIRAWKRVVQEFPDVALLIAGDGEERDKLEQLVHELDLESSVYFLGARDDIPDIINMLDLFIFPSLSEGLPISLLEAMCMGKIIVASDIEPIRNIVDDAAVMIPPADPAAISTALIDTINKFSERNIMGIKARKRLSAQFSPEDFARQHKTLYIKSKE